MKTQFGYDFYFTIGGEVLTLPITPKEVTIKSGSNNKKLTLIDGGEINILKSPSLMEIEFDARFPMREYPYSRWTGDAASNFEYYFNKFTKAKQDKQPVKFSIVRSTPNGNKTWGTGVSEISTLFSFEDLQTKESADDGDDVIVRFKLKQFKEYGVIKYKTPTSTPTSTSTSTSNTARPTENKNTSNTQQYTVKSGDTLWGIAKKHYNDGSKWKKIYDANKTVIEQTANKYRNGKGSSNGHWIYPNTVLVIPPK